MKKILLTGFFVVLFVTGFAQANKDLSHMTPALWMQDMDYLNKKIQKEFVSFDPNVKNTFQIEINKLKGNISDYDNKQMAIKLSELVAHLGDGHTEVQFLQRGSGFNLLPLIFYFYKEGLYITGSHEEYKKYIGMKVNSIGGKPVDEVVKLLTNLMTHDNKYEILHAGPDFINLPAVMKYLGLTDNYEKVAFSLTDVSGNTFDVQFNAKSIDEYIKGPWYRYTNEHDIKTPLSATSSKANYWYKYLEKENTVYFYYGVVNNQKGYPTIKKFIKKMFSFIDEVKPEKLVMDLRQNRGGNYHKSEPLIKAIEDRPWLNQSGKVYAISGRTTFSAAMVTCVFLKRETQAILIGEPSRGDPNKADNVEHFNLPNSGLRIEYTTKVKRHWPELGNADHVPVDIDIPLLFADYSRGVDAVMEYILKTNKK